MIHVYFVDYYTSTPTTGLNTYTSEVIGNFPRDEKNLIINFVWLNSERHTNIYREKCYEGNHIYIPKKIVSFSRSNSFDQTISEILIKEIKDNRNNIVHFNWINHCSIAWFLKKSVDCKTVLTKHCIPWRDMVTGNYHEFYRLHHALLQENSVPITHSQIKREQINYESIDHIITVTEFAKKSLEVLFRMPSDKISIIRNGIGTKNKKLDRRAERKELRKNYGIDESEKILLYAGNVNTRKGVFDLITAFKLLAYQKGFNDLRLVIAGSGNHSEALKNCEKYWTKIIFTGNLDKDTLYDFYAISDIGVVPSYIEQCSYTAIEMMHSGLPIIVSNVDGLSEMVNEQCGLKVKVNYDEKDGASVDINDLYEKIRYLFENREAAHQLASNAQVYARKNFSAEKMTQKTLQVYRKLLDSDQPIKHKPIDNAKPAPFINVPDNPMASIILPCYNGKKYLRECLDSIFEQTFGNFELILIDDGSEDSTKQIVESYRDARLIYRRNDENKGITHCLNQGIALSRGKYIARIDTDDRMAENRIQLQLDFLEKNLDYGMVGCSFELIDQHGMVINRIDQPTEFKEIKLGMLFRNLFMHPGVTMRADLAKRLRYDKEFGHCEDYELWTRIIKETKATNLPEYLLAYRVHSDSTTQKNFKDMQENTISLISRELDSLKLSHTTEELTLHAAITFGYGKRYFNTSERVDRLHQWLRRIFTAEAIKSQYKEDELLNFKYKLMKDYCGLEAINL